MKVSAQSHHAGVLEITTADVSGHRAAVELPVDRKAVRSDAHAEAGATCSCERGEWREVNASDFELHPS